MLRGTTVLCKEGERAEIATVCFCVDVISHAICYTDRFFLKTHFTVMFDGYIWLFTSFSGICALNAVKI